MTGKWLKQVPNSWFPTSGTERAPSDIYTSGLQGLIYFFDLYAF